MTHPQNNLLKFMYVQHQNGIDVCNLPFKQISDSSSNARNALDTLELDGYIEVMSRAIGCAIIKLTDYGLSYCEQTYGQ